MPFEMTVHDAFTERLDDGGMRVWSRGEDITDPAIVDRLRGNPYVVQRWVDDPAPEPEPEPSKAPAGKPALNAASASKPANPAPASAPAAAS
jgi:hypothetical protein